MTLDEFLKAKKIPGISGIDTRALTKIIRKHGTMRATLTHVGDSMDHVTDQLKQQFYRQTISNRFLLKRLIQLQELV